MSAPTNLKITDIIPFGDSSEAGENSEPSLAVNPLDPRQIIAGAFLNGFLGPDGRSLGMAPYFKSTDGGISWSDYGIIVHSDKSLAWLQDGSAALTATLLGGKAIFTYSGITSGSNFSAINSFPSTASNLDQPWIRTGPSGHVYISFNDTSHAGPGLDGSGDGKSASVLVSTNGGFNYSPVTIDKVGTTYQDGPSTRLAVNGDTVYAIFVRWNSKFDGSPEVGYTRYTSSLVIGRSDNGGADSFSAIGGGNGVQIAAFTDVNSFAASPLAMGDNRDGSEIAIAVDPNNKNRVVIVYGDSDPSFMNRYQLKVVESTDGGVTWSSTPLFTTTSSVRSAEPGLAIIANGTVGLLYNSYDPMTDAFTQHFLTTSDDFATTNDLILGTEKNNIPAPASDPYLGDFFDLTSVGNSFYGTFSASNLDDGTNALLNSATTYRRNFAGTPGTASFQLKDTSASNNVAGSIDPYVFSYSVVSGNSLLLGVNLAGAEFAGTDPNNGSVPGTVPGVYNKDYTYPTHAEIDYYASKGLGVIRLPFLWERLQHSELATLDPAELSRLDDVVNYATSKGLKVEIEPHDYGFGFGNQIGSSQTPNSAFANLWSQLAQHFGSNSNVIFGLMNEPHVQTPAKWLVSVNAAIAAIRGTGASQEILVPGTDWDGAWHWTTDGNSTVIGPGVQDPKNNFAFEVHQYLDQNGSGTSPGVYGNDPNLGVERLTAITEWAKKHPGTRLFLGEVGVSGFLPNKNPDQISLDALGNMLTYMQQNTDVWQGMTYWAGGPWWGNYMFSIEPQNGVDKPQMAVLVKHETATTATSPIVAPNNSSILGSCSNPVPASSLFTAGDEDGDSIIQYDFWGSGTAGGHWLLNNTALANGQDNFVDAAQLSQVTYQGGAGTETIWVRASDGVQYGAWTSINATNTAPVVTVPNPNVTVNHFIPVAASTLFTAGDPDTDNVVLYDFWDYGTTGSTWLLNGVPLLLGHENLVGASQLSQVTYRAGTGTETIWVRVNDGSQFGPWSAINATDPGPVVTPIQSFVSVVASLAASDLFTASDPDGDPVTQYDFWNTGGDAGGRWLLNGVPLPINQDNIVPAAQLGQVTYRASVNFSSSSFPLTDTLWVRASDGIGFGAWSRYVSVAFGPVINPTNNALTVSHLHTVAAASLFSASDADGLAITQYDFWNTGVGGGHWLLNGVALGSNQDNIVSAAQLSQVSYQSGAGTDTLWVRAGDTALFGAWSQGFTVTDTAPITTPHSNAVVGIMDGLLAASNLFTTSDADTDGITQYDFWDTGSDGGRWMLNGAALAPNQDNFVQASQLAQVTYNVGVGTDTLWVRASDGIQYGPWSNGGFTVAGTVVVQTSDGSALSTIFVGAGETVEVGSAFSDSVTFAGDTGTLKIDDSASFAGTVVGMTGKDTIDFADIDATKVQPPSFSGDSTGGMLTVSDGTHRASIVLLGNYMASAFVASSDGHGGTNVIDPQLSASTHPLSLAPSHS